MKTLTNAKGKILAVAGIVACAVITLVLAHGARSVRVDLEKVDYGTNYSAPSNAPPPLAAMLLRLIPKALQPRFGWQSESGTSGHIDKESVIFWLKFHESEAEAQPVTYALADETGFETAMLFNLYLKYRPGMFGTNGCGLIRGTSVIPWRSRRIYLRLYELNDEGKLERVAEFPMKNPGFRQDPGWQPQTLPITWATNGLVVKFVNATVGVAPPGPVAGPYNSFAGEWSEFRFQVSRDGRPEAGWTINEMWLADTIGKPIRISAEDNGAFNHQFSRNEGDAIVCVHRWDFWTDAPGWKFRVHLEHPDQPGFWVECQVRPQFVRPPQ